MDHFRKYVSICISTLVQSYGCQIKRHTSSALQGMITSLCYTPGSEYFFLHLTHFAYFTATKVNQNPRDSAVTFIREYNTGSTHFLLTVRIVTKLLWCTHNFPVWRIIKCGWVSLKIFPRVSFLSMERQYPDKRHLRFPCFHALAFISSLAAQNLPSSLLPRTALQLSSVSFLL